MAKTKTETTNTNPIEWFIERIGKTVTVTTAAGETNIALIRNSDDAKKMCNAQDGQQLTYTDDKTEE